MYKENETKRAFNKANKQTDRDFFCNCEKYITAQQNRPLVFHFLRFLFFRMRDSDRSRYSLLLYHLRFLFSEVRQSRRYILLLFLRFCIFSVCSVRHTHISLFRLQVCYYHHTHNCRLRQGLFFRIYFH